MVYFFIISHLGFFSINYKESQRKEIAQYAVEHDNNYKATGEKYGISYQQVAAWVRKYQQTSPAKEVETTKESQEKDNNNKTNSLDILSRKDPVLEAQLRDVKKRLGLI